MQAMHAHSSVAVGMKGASKAMGAMNKVSLSILYFKYISWSRILDWAMIATFCLGDNIFVIFQTLLLSVCALFDFYSSSGVLVCTRLVGWVKLMFRGFCGICEIVKFPRNS